MKLNIKKIYPFIIVVTGIALIKACQEDTGDQDLREKEQRFFDLYVGANYPDVEPQPNGFYFLEHKAGTGSSPDSDDWLLVNHVNYTIPEDYIYESYVENVVMDNRHLDPDTTALYGPYKMQNGTITDGLRQGILLMSEGAQATIFFTSDLGYGADGTAVVSPFKSLKYEIELLEVIKDIVVYEQDKINAYMDTIPVADTIHDPVTDAIMYYVIDQASDGKPVVIDSLVQIAYKGYLMDGRVFDEATADSPFEFKVGDTEFITGWDLGLLKLHEGEKARFIIPYPMGYGEAGKEDPSSGLTVIPPYETLLFDMEVISVKEDPGDIGDGGEE